MRLHPDGKTVWVTGETDHDLTLLDAETGKKVGRIEVGKRPRDLAFSPDGSRAYVTSEVDGTLWVLDVASRKPIATVKLAEGAKPMGVVVSDDGKRVYVANGRGKTVSVRRRRRRTRSPIRWRSGSGPGASALTGDGKKLYTANGPSDDVTVVDAATLQVLRKIPAGETPWGVGDRTGAGNVTLDRRLPAIGSSVAVVRGASTDSR